VDPGVVAVVGAEDVERGRREDEFDVAGRDQRHVGVGRGHGHPVEGDRHTRGRVDGGGERLTGRHEGPEVHTLAEHGRSPAERQDGRGQGCGSRRRLGRGDRSEGHTLGRTTGREAPASGERECRDQRCDDESGVRVPTTRHRDTLIVRGPHGRPRAQEMPREVRKAAYCQRCPRAVTARFPLA